MIDQNVVRATGPHGQLAEVWGDVVSRPQLAKAMIIGAILSVVVYYVTLATISPLAATPAVGKALAMLAGIVGSVVSGAVCSRMFAPKRVVVEQAETGTAWQADILEQLEQEGGPIGRVEDLPPVVAQEMREVGLYDLFKNYQDRRGVDRQGE
ncbi:hypothetical protein GCM10011491_22920 [Brucella endophytica]|uniref:Uncharacterized protein n=1 Tax=Brucella endophytica TaxID=1963359 RepID=A0A916WFD4_9HYPH|nr:hypothetical protein [Brucella endophytica]GGA94115.1 hypothetical protein GCM10011491_22920 [Brucella endophytica]